MQSVNMQISMQSGRRKQGTHGVCTQIDVGRIGMTPPSLIKNFTLTQEVLFPVSELPTV